MPINELLVYGYVHDTVEKEFFFNTKIVPHRVIRTILAFVPKAIKLSIYVSLGPCTVFYHTKKKYTIYTFKFKIMNEKHSFSARYSSLYKFHVSLFENKSILESFGYHPPEFPSKQWWKDFTKPINYNKRAIKLLKYFETLIMHHSVLTNDIFQNGIFLPKHLREILHNTFSGYYWPKLPDLPPPIWILPNSPSTGSRPPWWSGPALPMSPIDKIILTDALTDLLQQTDKTFVNCYGDMLVPVNDHNGYDSIDDMYLFSINNVLPKHLLSDVHHINHRVDNNNININMINIKLFEAINKKEDHQIDDITFDIRDAILESCDVECN